MPAWEQWFLRGLIEAMNALVGRASQSDFAQDVLGARALLHGGDAYPLFSGIVSTHPPTAFLLALPVADLPWTLVGQLWAWAMIGCLGLTAWAFGLRWYMILALAPLLLWPPVTWSIEQLTPVWLVGLALAWRYRASPAAGAWIGLASLTKFMPAFSLVPLIRKQRRSAVLAFIVTWAVALALLAILNSDAVRQYLGANFVNTAGSANQVERPDNGALLPFAFHIAGLPGLSVALLVVAAIVWLGFRRDADSATTWALWTWIGVAVLPIAWTYSLLPLLPWLLRSLRHGGPTERLMALLALSAPFLGAAPTSVPDVVFGSIAFAGVSFAMGAIRQRAPRPASAISHRSSRPAVSLPFRPAV